LLLSRPFTGRWYDRYGAEYIIYPCIVVFGLGLLILGLSHTVWTFLLAAGLIGLGWGTMFSSFQTLAIQSSNPKRSSTATGTYLSVFDVGVGGGSFVAGMLVNYMEIGSMYILFAVYSLFGLVLFYLIRKSEKKKAKNIKHLT